jgi:hypothetical protein
MRITVATFTAIFGLGLVACGSEPAGVAPLVVRDDPYAIRDAGPQEPPPSAPGASTPPGPPSPAAPPKGAIYLIDARTLYVFDPVGDTLDRVGKVTCPGFADDDDLVDVAVDRDGTILATSFGPADKLESYFFTVSPTTAQCVKVATNPGMPTDGLTFVPRGILDSANDALVGYSGESFVRFDPKTGQRTILGLLNRSGASARYYVTGDLVVLPGGVAYATGFRVGRPSTEPDQLLQIDPVTGGLVKVVGPLYGEHVTGLATWGGKLFGVSRGSILEIDAPTAKTFPRRPKASFEAGNDSPSLARRRRRPSPALERTRRPGSSGGCPGSLGVVPGDTAGESADDLDASRERERRAHGARSGGEAGSDLSVQGHFA